jgi:molybdenum-dependent DNA-binding transcriptional regulator ModE
LDTVVLAGLRVAAETWTDDGFTRARLSDRRQDLDQEIEDYVVEHERRSRENGGSYLGHLLHKHFQPPRRVSAKEKKAEAKRAAEAQARLQETLQMLKSRRKPKRSEPDDGGIIP